MAHLAVDHHPKSCVVILHVLQVSLVLLWSSSISKQRLVYRLEKCQKPLHNIPDPYA